MLLTIDTRTGQGPGLVTFTKEELRDKAREVLPGNMRWGVEKLWIEVDPTLAATTGQKAATPGRRLYEFFDRLDIHVAGFEHPACLASGRSLRRRGIQIHRKLTHADPADVADANATITTAARMFLEFDFKDPRLANPMDAVPHASALGRGHIKLTVIGSASGAPITGITVTSLTLTLKAKLVPIPKDQVPLQVSFVEVVAGEGQAGSLQFPVDPADALSGLFLFLTGEVNATNDPALLEETSELDLSVDGKRQIDRQSVRVIEEQWNATVPSDAALDATVTALEFVDFVYPEIPGIQTPELLRAAQGGNIRAFASLSDSGNAGSGVSPRLVSDAIMGVHRGGKREHDYTLATQGRGRFAYRKATMNGKTSVPPHIEHLIPSRAVRIG